MAEYTQLNLEERKMLFQLKRKKTPVAKIAVQLKRARSTINRELKRNVTDHNLGYLPDSANQNALERKARHGTKIERYPELKKTVIAGLKKQWSPETISGRLKKTNFPFLVSHEGIYQFIYGNDGRKLGLFKYLVKSKPKRGKLFGRKVKKSTIPDRVSIHDRNKSIDTREEFGHQEGDLTFFKGNQSINLGVVVERKSRFVQLILNHSKHSAEVVGKIFNRLAQKPDYARKSITFDNGVEFTRHGLLKKHLNMDTYFCDKHSPWQKGQVEQMNSMIHRFMPKKKSIKEATEEMINSVQDALNNMPRKCLGFRTPAEVYNEELLKCGALQH